MKPIGGYFGLELNSKSGHYHNDALLLNTARNCFEYVLRARPYRKVYIPYYTCEVMLEPINKLELDYEFYRINELLEPAILPELKAKEAFLYTNYYGLKQQCVERLASKYGKQLIVDNAQAFYSVPLYGIDTFYSARKFFGVADGAYLYTDKKLAQEFQQDVSYERMSHLLKRADIGAEAGYKDFRGNDDSLCNQEIKRMSKLTESILASIDYKAISQKRRQNYAFLNDALGDSNLIHLDMDEDAVPMVYPYLTQDPSLKQRLIENKIFVATYWPNVFGWCFSQDLEYNLANNLLSLPIDQRYGKTDINCIMELVKKL
ncbi:MAG: hypothetical protein IJK62_01865 [Bacteroidales bacterium]|nr:hypothetical protein [Bacteroidales bacterium]